MSKACKRYCRYIGFKIDLNLIRKTNKLNSVEEVLPEICDGMKEVNIQNMEILMSYDAQLSKYSKCLSCKRSFERMSILSDKPANYIPPINNQILQFESNFS